mgnify:CR=1 FL=1
MRTSHIVPILIFGIALLLIPTVGMAQEAHCQDGIDNDAGTDWICPDNAAGWSLSCVEVSGSYVCADDNSLSCVQYYCPDELADPCVMSGTDYACATTCTTCVGPPWVDIDDPDCQCLADVTSLAPNNCNSGDLGIVLIGLGTQSDGCVNPNDYVTMRLRARLSGGGQTRYDLGMWVNLDGTDAFHHDDAYPGPGLCGRQILVPAGTVTGDCNDSFPGDPGPLCSVLDGDGPYRDNDGDICADVNVEEWTQHPDPTSPYNQYDAIFDFIDPRDFSVVYYQFPCADLNPTDGVVDLSACTTWKQNAKTTCSTLSDVAVGTVAKCRCSSVRTNVPVANMKVNCGQTLNDGDGDGVLDPGETLTNTVTLTNAITCSDDPDFPPSEPRFSCGTASYVRIVVPYDATYGSISGLTLGGVSGDSGDVQDTGSAIIWTPRVSGSSSAGDYGIVGPGKDAFLEYTYTKNQTDVPGDNLSFDATTYWSNSLDTGNLTDLSGAEAQTCLDCTCTTSTSTTPVTLASFRTLRESVTVTAEWATSTEVGTVGFNILGETPDGWARLNEEVIPAGGDTPHGRSYRANLVVPEEIDTFKLEEVDLRGGTRRHGPFAQDRFHGAVLDVAEVDWQAIRSQHDGTASQLAAARPDRPVAKGGRSAVDIVDLLVREDGLYRVTYEDLAAAGFDLAAANLNRLGVTSRGQDVPISLYTPQRGSFGPGSWIEFYGEKLDSLYTDENVYRLRTDISQPARVSIDATVPEGDIVTTYTARRIVEENIGYSYSSTTGDPWYQQRMLAYSSPRSFTYPLEVTDLEDGPAKLLVHLFSINGMPEEPDHHVVVKLNGVTVAEELWDGAVDLPLDVPLPPGALGEGANTLTIELPGDLGVWYDLVYLESYGASYPRRLLAEDGALSFVGRGEVLQVEGLDSLPTAVYRQDLDGLTRLTGFETIPAGAGFTVRLPGTELGATYHLATESALRVPGMRAGRSAPEIGRGRAEYLIISHPAFLDAVRPLLLLRQEDGYSVQLVDVEDVYSEFGHGIFGADALRAYIEHAASRMGTEMVLLVGGDTYDYHDYLGTGSVSFLPSPYVATSEWVSYAPADASYADVDADGVPDIAIGRLPARTVSDAVAMVDKILDYETRSYPRTGVFAADTYDQDASQSFTAIADSYIRDLPAGWNAQRAYLDRMSVDQARSRLVAGINAGVALTVFVGHSGPASWTFLDLFDATDAANLTNIGRPTVVTQYGCWNTYYASPVYQHLAPALMAGDTGAAAVLGATALTDDANENLFGSVLMPRLVEPGMTMGEAILTSKQDLGAKAPEAIDILLGWNLLGDPGLVLER